MQIKIYFAIQAACLIGMSFLSTYKLPDLSKANWDIALFLTPLGMIKNSLDKHSVMKSFYLDFAKVQMQFPMMNLLLIIILWLILLGAFLKVVQLLDKKGF